ncbi:MAG TPA: amidohydrolase family protein [Burkholderiales bacterium]
MTEPQILSAGCLLSSASGKVSARSATVRYDANGILSVDVGGGEAHERTLLMPPFSNAHDHGRGLKTLAYGVVDQAVEAWVSATYTLPPVDPYLIAAAAFGRMALNGIASVVHCHLSRTPQALIEEAIAVRRAADDVGVRVAFVVPLRDRHRLGYAADDAVLSYLPPEDRAGVSARLKPIVPVEEQVALVEEIARVCESEHFRVQFGPVGAEWCSDALLERVAAASKASGRRVHMHLLESKYQREWADYAYPGGIVVHLDALGLLSERLTVAHGTWLRPDECRLLARRGVIVSINTSSNLRLRSGVAPVADLLAAGAVFALGLDALALDDDDDMLREMRLTRLLHAGLGFGRGLEPDAVLQAAVCNGARAVTGEPGGEIVPGRPADLLLLQLDEASADMPPALYDALSVLHARADGSAVRTLVVAGRKVVEEGRLVGIDLRRVEAELRAQLDAFASELADLRPALARVHAALECFYEAGGHCGGARPAGARRDAAGRGKT